MAALVAAIHVFNAAREQKTWMAGTSPAMTENGVNETACRTNA
jgi:intracellular sulfur oxidation DsrE/DsrF family protein